MATSQMKENNMPKHSSPSKHMCEWMCIILLRTKLEVYNLLLKLHGLKYS